MQAFDINCGPGRLYPAAYATVPARISLGDRIFMQICTRACDIKLKKAHMHILGLSTINWESLHSSLLYERSL